MKKPVRAYLPLSRTFVYICCKAAVGKIRKQRTVYSKYLWQRRYICCYGRKYESVTSQRNNTQESIKRGCPAYLVISQLRDGQTLHIEHKHGHAGHLPGSETDRRESRMGPLLRQWLADQVADGHTFETLQAKLRLTNDELDRIEEDGNSAPDSFFVSDDDLHNLFRKIKMNNSRMDPDMWRSLKKWADKIEVAGGSVLYKRWTQEDGSKTFIFAIVTKWQRQIILQGTGSAMVCLDSTHNTSFTLGDQDPIACPLFTLVAKHHAAGRGVPIAFCIVSHESHEPIQQWLQWMRDSHAFQPQAVMIDCSDTEALAISKVFPHIPIRYCLWHLLRALQKQIKSKVSIKPGSRTNLARDTAMRETHRLRSKANRDFTLLIKSSNTILFDERWAVYQEEWKQYPDLVGYVRKEWISTRERWAVSYLNLPDYGIQTNNLVESWHSFLKIEYLRRERKQRVDALVYILLEEVMLDLRQCIVKVVKGIHRRPKSSMEEDRYKRAMSIPWEQAVTMVAFPEQHYHGRPILVVRSFVEPGKEYRLTVVDDLISSCSCEDYGAHNVVCKHMYLAERLSAYNVSYPLAAAGPSVPILSQISSFALKREQPEPAEEEETESAGGVYDRVQREYHAFSQWLVKFNNLSPEQRAERQWQQAAVTVQQQ